MHESLQHFDRQFQRNVFEKSFLSTTWKKQDNFWKRKGPSFWTTTITSRFGLTAKLPTRLSQNWNELKMFLSHYPCRWRNSYRWLWTGKSNMNFFETMNSRLNLDSFFPSMATKVVAIAFLIFLDEALGFWYTLCSSCNHSIWLWKKKQSNLLVVLLRDEQPQHRKQQRRLLSPRPPLLGHKIYSGIVRYTDSPSYLQ